MKKVKLLSLLLTIGAFSFMLTNCSDDDENSEVCEQEVYCDEEAVTVCCESDSCHYEYDGTIYSPSSNDDLAALSSELGCSTNSSGRMDAEAQKALIQRLKDQVARVKAKLQ